VIRTFISLPAGFARVHFIKFIVYTILGSVPWTIALIYAGMMLGANWEMIRSIGHEASLFVAGALVVLIMYYIIKKRKNA
jgi:membrane protein DedA with SNARE-associated domain